MGQVFEEILYSSKHYIKKKYWCFPGRWQFKMPSYEFKYLEKVFLPVVGTMPIHQHYIVGMQQQYFVGAIKGFSDDIYFGLILDNNLLVFHYEIAQPSLN